MSTVDNSVMYDATQASTRASGAAGASGAVASQRVATQPPAAMRSLTVLPRVQIAGDQAQIVTPRKPRYERVKQLGEGAFGEVELAVDNDIERTVAIKRIKANVLDEDSVLRFVSEVQSVGRLEHPGIVPIHDVGCDEQGYFFVMKYVEGETLESIIAKLRAGDVSYQSRYTMEARTALMLSLCRAVQFAHTRGYVHRDIKPANIMVGAYGEVVLMDWGLAKRISDTGAPTEMYNRTPLGQDAFGTMLGYAIGTPAYMSPEQARGEHDRADGRSDIYSLSAVFFELLTLRHYLPPKSSVQALLEAVKTEEPMGPLAMHHRHQVSPELAWLVSRGLAKDPAQRYQSLGELIARIEAALNGDAPVQCPCTGLKRANGQWSDFIDHHPNLAVTAAVLGLYFVIAGIASTLWFAVR